MLQFACIKSYSIGLIATATLVLRNNANVATFLQYLATPESIFNRLAK